MSVYFIQEANDPTGPIKIGWAKAPQKRLKQIQMMSPRELEIKITLDGNRNYEKDIHHWFGDKRLYGEWFEASDEVLEFMVAPLPNDELSERLSFKQGRPASKDNRKIIKVKVEPELRQQFKKKIAPFSPGEFIQFMMHQVIDGKLKLPHSNHRTKAAAAIAAKGD